MKKIHLYLLLSMVVFTTGCPNEPSKNFKGKDSLVSNVNDYLRNQQGRYNCAVDEGKNYIPVIEGQTPGPNSGRCGDITLADPLGVAQRVRNDAIEDAIAVIDSNYNDFINKLDTRRSRADFIADVIDLGTGAATGIVKGERPNQILGIALTAFRGARRSSELNFYKQQTTPILIAKMDDNRARVYAGILTKRTRTVNEYSMKEAIRDIVTYFNAGTLIRAFAELAKDTSDKAKESEQVVRELKGENIEISDIPSLAAEQRSDASFAIRRSLAQELLDAQTAANAIPIPTPANPDNITAAEQTAIDKAKAERAAKLKTIRGKLDIIWKEIEAAEGFKPSIDKMNEDPAFADILDRLHTTPPGVVTEDEYLALINKITALTKKDETLSKELLSILQKANR
jgi:hypothetical protein